MHGAEAMERPPCSQHAEHSETPRHTIFRKEIVMNDVTIVTTGLGFPEGPWSAPTARWC